jgi:tetratricopeptide (TPR) repeat protein
MQCEQVLRDGIAERYLRGALSAADQEAFERHYFECASCFDELESLRLLRQALAEGVAANEAVSEARGGWAPGTWAAAAAVVAVIGGGLFWLAVNSNRPSGGASEGDGRVAEQQAAVPVLPAPETPTPRVPEAGHPAQPGPTAPRVNLGGAARSAALAALAVVQAPPYTPAPLRGVLDEAARRFREAMKLYVDRDYEGAKAGLREAAELDPERPDIAFFLGICALLTDEPEAAIAELRRTIALGESPYLEEAHFYVAKAHLRRGELAAAASQLEETVQLRGEREQEARELLRKLEALRKAPP